MKIRSLTLVWSIILLPLNSITSYGSDIINTEMSVNSSTVDVESNNLNLFDIDEIDHFNENNTEANSKLLEEFISKFNAISPEAIKMALNSYNYLLEKNKLSKQNILTIVDFSKPSSVERLFVIDIKNQKIISKSLCAHGKNSGEDYANAFSNNNQSYQSSLGVFIASETYEGSKGFSLKLDGQEAGINNNARERGVVIHGADYVSYDFVQAHGRLGRSQGCPALPLEKNEKIINIIKGGSCFFIYHPNTQYKKYSSINKSYDETALNNILTNNN
jgi:hypothetical protein